MTTADREAAIIAFIDAIEADPPPCLPVADCTCDTCMRYCALWGALDAVREEADRACASGDQPCTT